MLRVLHLIRRFARLDTPVLIQGETGTGKELVARALHALSPRVSKPLVIVDCGALPESLAESELFGHERGAFTGADRPYAGRIEAGAGGTVFLDEVNAISPGMQAKLLRFLEEREFCRVGQQRPVPVDVRLLSASNVPLEQLVAKGQMRADFFYRLNVLRLDLPPLRERLDDLPLLVRQLIETDPVIRGCGVTQVSDEALAQLRAMPWAGNVRELRNTLRHAVAIGAEDGVLRRLETSSLPDARRVDGARPSSAQDALSMTYRSWMRAREREYLTSLIARHRRVSQQVAVSGLPRRTLYRKIRSLGLSYALVDSDACELRTAFPEIAAATETGSLPCDDPSSSRVESTPLRGA